MNKQLSVGLAVLALAASLTACGGGIRHNADHGAAPETTTASPATTASESATAGATRRHGGPQDGIVQRGRHCG